MRLEGPAIFELKTTFLHRLVFNKNKENERADYLKTYSAKFYCLSTKFYCLSTKFYRLSTKFYCLSTKFYRLSTKATKKLAYEPALKRNEKNIPPSWLAGFTKRNETVSLQKTEVTSIGRAKGFNQSIGRFFANLEALCV